MRTLRFNLELRMKEILIGNCNLLVKGRMADVLDLSSEEGSLKASDGWKFGRIAVEPCEPILIIAFLQQINPKGALSCPNSADLNRTKFKFTNKQAP